MQLRPYQSEAIDAAYSFLRERDGNPVIEIPTGGGKSAILATICMQAVSEWGGRVLVLTHVKELIEQLRDTLARVWPGGDVGVYSAGLKSRDTSHSVIIAGIQSVHKRACDLGRFDLVLVDECHLIPADGDGMYQAMMKDLRIINPQVRLVGLTATPYRLDSGLIYGPDRMLSDVCYSANVRDLISQGYLSPLRGKNGGHPDLDGVHKRGGDYIESELQDVMATDDRVRAAVDEMRRHGADRRSWLVFCCGIRHADMVRADIESRGIACRMVTGETPPAERAAAVADFRSGALRCLVNVAVFTTGFDAPNVDMVVMLRPTCSPGLYYQIVGRGLRKADGKADCLILDLAGNIETHGPVDRIRRPQAKGKKDEAGEAPTRTCPKCEEIHAISDQTCPACGYAYPPPEIARHGTNASEAHPVSDGKPRKIPVVRVSCTPHVKKGAEPGDGTPRTVRVRYWQDMRDSVSEWVCVEHKGFARRKAEMWFESVGGRPSDLGADAEEAAAFLQWHLTSAVRVHSLTVTDGDKFPEILARECERLEIDEREPEVPAVAAPGFDDSELLF